MSQQLQITFNDGFWSATSERWALNAHDNKFRSLERLLAELAAMGIRSVPGLSWEELPPAEGFNQYLLHAEIDRYLRREPLSAWADLCQKGCYPVVGACLDEQGDWCFFLSLAHNREWRDRTVESFKECGYRWVVSMHDPGCEGVQDPVAYMRRRLQSMTDDLQAAIAAG